jgi:hypothetical protein
VVYIYIYIYIYTHTHTHTHIPPAITPKLCLRRADCAYHIVLKQIVSCEVWTEFLYHLRWQNGPFWATAFIRRFCQIASGFYFFGFHDSDFFVEQVQPCVEPPTWRTGSSSCVSQWQGGPVIPPGIGFPFLHLLRLTGLRWRYSNPPPRGENLCIL